MTYHLLKNVLAFKIYSDELEVCVKMTTGTKPHNDGNLKVTMNGEIIANGNYAKGELVIDNCFNSFNSLRTMTLSNPSNDAWIGRIVITEGRRPTLIECDGCTGAAYSGEIVVDGDQTGKPYSPTRCLDGNTCSITWSIKGTLLFKRI